MRKIYEQLYDGCFAGICGFWKAALRVVKATAALGEYFGGIFGRNLCRREKRHFIFDGKVWMLFVEFFFGKNVKMKALWIFCSFSRSKI